MRTFRLVLALALAGSAIAIGSPAIAVDPVGTVNISSLTNQDLVMVALSPGRVTWVNRTPKGSPLVKRGATLDGAQVVLGPGTTLGRTEPKSNGFLDDDFRGFSALGASGSRTGWATETHAYYYENGVIVARVTNGGRLSTGASVTRTLSAPSHVLAVSGTRVLYQNLKFPSSKKYFRLLDLRTGVSTDLTATFGGAAKVLKAVALFGNSLYFARNDGSIWRKTLGATSSSVKVVDGGSFSTVTLFAWGDFIAWDRYSGGHVCGYRNLGISDEPLSYPNCPVALTDAGAILRNPGTGAYTLQHYAGDTVALPVPTDAKQVAIDGGRLAWVQANGTGRIAPLPNAPDAAPRYLGNALAPTKYQRGGSSWRLDLVTTSALKTCSVAIRNAHGSTIRTLPCSSGLLSAGEIQARWDGRNGSGVTVPASTYYWVVTAADADSDALLRASGEPGTVGGAITVS